MSISWLYIFFFKLILIRKLFEIQLSLFTLAHFNKNTNVCLSTNGLLKFCFKMLQNKKRIMNIQIKIFFLNNWINKKKNPPALKLKYFCILVSFFVAFYLFVVSFILWPLSSVWFFKHLLWHFFHHMTVVTAEHMWPWLQAQTAAVSSRHA